MTLSELSIRKPVFAWMLMAGLILFGWISFNRMGVGMMPDVDMPMVNINLRYEGAAPEVMEKDVIDPIEEGMLALEGVKEVSSSSKNSGGSVTVTFNLSRNIDAAIHDVQTTLAQIQRKLPKDMDPPTVSKTNPEDQPILWMTVMSEKMSEKDLMAYVSDILKDKFSTVPGVGEVFLGGYVGPALRVWVSSEKLQRYSLTVTDILSAISAEHSELPAGYIETKEKEWNVRTLGEALSPEEFEKLAINRRGGAPNFTPIPLSNVARIEDGLSDIRRKSRSMGKPAVGLGIRKQRGANAVAVAQAAKARMASLTKDLPPGMEMSINFDSTQFIEEAVHELNFTLFLSAILTAAVCWLFLGSWSATMNVVMAIPTSIIGSFTVLYFLGFTLNAFTLLGLSLAIGIVVDDAIMVLENIVRHKEHGKEKFQAALDGSQEIAFAAMAATVAIIAIFLPVAFMQGIIGKFLYQFGMTLSVAVLLSLLEALTLTPMRCSQFLEIGERTSRLGKGVEKFFARGSAAYARSLPFVLNHRWKTLGAAMLFFVLSMGFGVKFLKQEFIPAQDQSRLMLRVQAPIGSSLAFTDGKFKEVESVLAKEPAVHRYFGAIGGFGGGDVNTGIIFITLKDKDQRPINPATGKNFRQQELADLYRGKLASLKDVKIFFQDLSLASFSGKRGYPVEATIRGPEWETLIQSTEKLTEKLEATGKLTDVDSNYRAGQPEIQVIPNRAKALARGVSTLEINQTVNALIGGVIAGKYSKGGRRRDVRVRLEQNEVNRMEDINRLYVRNNRGELVPLRELVELKQAPSLQAIYRQDRERSISLFANVAKGSSQGEAIELVQKLSQDVLPPGYRLVMSGSSEEFKSGFQELIFALLLGLAVSYMVLASQFNSFVHPITVLVALPFSVSGAFLALLLAGQTLNLYSLIGLVLLMGIVKKNSILLVDFTNQKKETGLPTRTALIEACPVRLRPILMTSIATIAGAIPPALALGPGAEVRIPMATSVIGGVLVSTLLTLFVVPAVYSLLDFRGRKQTAKERAHAEEKPLGRRFG